MLITSMMVAYRMDAAIICNAVWKPIDAACHWVIRAMQTVTAARIYRANKEHVA